MRNKINKCINDSFEGYGAPAVNLLEQLFKEETLSLISFLRENYELYESPFGSHWTTVDGKELSDEELLSKFLDERNNS